MPGFHVKDLKGAITSLARGYLFNVSFDSAPVSNLTGDKTKYLVRSSSTPESTITPLEVPWQGQLYKIGSTHEFAEWTCTFNVDDKAQILKDFYEWQRLVHDPNTNVQGRPAEYLEAQATVELLDVKGEEEKPIITYKLHHLWPSGVAGVAIAQDSKEVSQVEVTFQYQWHTIE